MKTVLSLRATALATFSLLGLAVAGSAVYNQRHVASVEPGLAAGANATPPTLANQPLTPAPATEGSDVACRVQKGATRAWALESTLTAAIDPQMLGLDPTSGAAAKAAGTQTPAVTTHAILQLEALADSDEHGATYLASLADVSPDTEARVGSLAHPFLVHLANDCSLTGYARAASATILSSRTQQAMVYELSFVVPRDTSTPFTGRDSAGEYLANVGTGKDDEGDLVRRRVLNYRELWQRGDVNLAADHGARKVDASALTIRRDAGLWFQSMKGEQTVSGGGVLRATTTLKANPTTPIADRFAHASRSDASYIWEDLLPRDVRPLPSTKPTAAETAERATLKDVPLEEAFTRFEAQVHGHANINDQWRGLSAYLEAHPEAIPRVRTTLRNNVLPPNERAGAFLALGMARVPEARDALVQINKDKGTTWLNRGQSALLLANRSDVDLSLAKQFRADASGVTQANLPAPQQEYSRTAALALGVMAGVHQDTMPGVADETRGMIANVLSAAQTPDRLSPAFGAMGNLGDAAAVPQIRQWSQHKDAAVRMVVPRALRRIPFAQTHDLVVDWLGRETSPGVKRELYGNLRGIVLDQQVALPSDLTAVAIRDLAAGPDVTTRQSLVRILGPLAQTNLAVRQALVARARVEVTQRAGVYNLIAQYVPGDALTQAMLDMQASATATEVTP